MQIQFRFWLFPLLVFTLVFVACEKKSNSFHTLSIALEANRESHGLVQVNSGGDGRTQEAQAGGKECQQLMLKEGRSDAYLYLSVDSAFKQRPLPPLTVTVEYFDALPTTFRLEYDSAIEGKGGGGYTPSKERIQTKGLKEWQKVKFVLDRPQLSGRQNDHADFRLSVGSTGAAQFFVRSVTLSKE